MTERLRPFQRKFLKGALAPGVSTAAMSMPRGNGKTWLAAHILTRCLTPGDALHVAGAEYLLCAASLEQARLCFRFIRAALEIDDPDAYQPFRFLDSHTRIGIAHKATNTRLRVLSSNGKTAMGIVGCPLLVADEPGAWEVNGGQLMADAIDTAQGKPGSPMRVIYIGTLAPASDGWWHDLIQGGSRASTYVQMLRGDRDTWDSWQTIRKANPLTAISPEFRAKLREERDAARSDTRLKARFLSYRLNVPTGDEAKMLLDVSEWELAMARQVPEREGAPIVGIDLGAGRAWSAATAVWSNGRTEALALAPGIPEMEEQETAGPGAVRAVPAARHQRTAPGSRRIADAAGVGAVGRGAAGMGAAGVDPLRQVPYCRAAGQRWAEPDGAARNQVGRGRGGYPGAAQDGPGRPAQRGAGQPEPADGIHGQGTSGERHEPATCG